MNFQSAHAVFESAQPGRAQTISPTEIDRELLSRAIGAPFFNRLPTLIPLLVIGLVAWELPNRTVIYVLLAAQCVAAALAAATSGHVKRAIDCRRSAERPIAIWLACETVSGAIWGLMVIGTVDIMSTGGAPSLISVVLLVTVTAACLVAASAPGLSQALLAGFAATSIPITFYHYDAFGITVVIALLLSLPGLLWIVTRLRMQAHTMLRTELENRFLTQQLAAALAHSDHLSRHDSLTGLLNRRAFEPAAVALRNQRHGMGICIVALDLDRFKSINDRFGHTMGDAVLKCAAKLLEEELRALDIGSPIGDDRCTSIARWGGEEFVAAVAHAPDDDIAAMAERIRAAFADYRDSDWPDDLMMTASFGVTGWMEGEALEDAVARADALLYEAKAAGRDTVRAA
ncbi:MAG: GGDEF domain-containing protein [Sphingomonadaceae bacterium]|nr:GGDEF domain-containing protein [Sphingomonadaceae bacterium]